MLSELKRYSEESVSQLKTEVKQTKDEVRQKEIEKLKEIEKKDIESKKNVLIAELKHLTERVNDILEQKEKADTEFENTKQKFGFLLNNFLGLADEQKLFQKISQKYYSQQKLETLKKDLSLKQVELNQIEINNFSILGKTIILCENQNYNFYNNLDILNYSFVPEKNCETLFHKIRGNDQFKGLRDRDYIADAELELIEKKFNNYFILRMYSFENYIFHPDNLSELKLQGFDKQEYIDSLTKLKNDKLNEILPNITSSRLNIQEFKIDSEKIKQVNAPTLIASDLQSDDFEIFYKYFNIKKYRPEYLTRFLGSIHSPQEKLSKTGWFATKIKAVLRLDEK